MKISAWTLIAFAASTTAFASDQWEKTVCKAQKDDLTITLRVFHSVADIVSRGMLRTTVMVKVEGKEDLPPKEWLMGSKQFDYGIHRGHVLVESPKLNLLYRPDGTITGTYKLTKSSELELSCENISQQSIPSLFKEYFAGNAPQE